mmetsp:Transcript_26792/g.82237  ORF Transcript_26792/g.82237 Transcript_26792/m.82237 type:complete len:274 (+) Transcript_26792:351-1172(+)
MPARSWSSRRRSLPEKRSCFWTLSCLGMGYLTPRGRREATRSTWLRDTLPSAPRLAFLRASEPQRPQNSRSRFVVSTWKHAPQRSTKRFGRRMTRPSNDTKRRPSAAKTFCIAKSDVTQPVRHRDGDQLLCDGDNDDDAPGPFQPTPSSSSGAPTDTPLRAAPLRILLVTEGFSLEGAGSSTSASTSSAASSSSSWSSRYPALTSSSSFSLGGDALPRRPQLVLLLLRRRRAAVPPRICRWPSRWARRRRRRATSRAPAAHEVGGGRGDVDVA